MNYYGAKELADSFRTVRKNTITIAEEIPEDKYGFRAAPESRTIAQTLIHISQTPSMQLHLHQVKRLTTLEGFDFMSFFGPLMAEEQAPHTKAQIISKLKTGGEHYAAFLEGCKDDFLAERVKMMPGMTPESKTRFEMLLGVKEHEMHHRGQLMLIERMVGIVPHLTREMQARMAAMSGKS